MAAPAVVLVPATPLRPSALPSPQTELGEGPSSSVETSRSSSHRSSSETTAVTIYSMYGDDRSSWAEPKSDGPSRTPRPRPSLQQKSSWREPVPKRPSTATTTTTTDSERRRSGVKSNRESLPAGDLGEWSRQRASQSLSVYGGVEPEDDWRPTTRKSSLTAADLPARPVSHAGNHTPLPPSSDPRPTRPSRESPPANTLPSRSSSRAAGQVPQRPSAEDLRRSSPVPPPTPPKETMPQLPTFLSRRSTPVPPVDPTKLSPPPAPTVAPVPRNVSTTSLVPSQAPSEDRDSFHVRSTYAVLDVSGVKGDGYEEGVELTRARSTGRTPATSARSPEEIKGDLDEREILLLESLDRYGFFTKVSHDRLILIPSAPLAKPLAPVPPSTSTAPASPPNLPFLSDQEQSPAQKKKEVGRIGKWGRMLTPRTRDPGGNIANWRISRGKEKKWSERVYKGVPDRWRAAAWWTLIERHSRSPDGWERPLAVQYRERIDQPSPHDIQIDLDVPRTISGHILFRTRYGLGQRSLFHVLHSFSLLCPDCGYCQGMGPLAATLLCYLEPERAYAAMVRIHDAYQMHEVFSPGFPGMLEAFYVQERIMERMMPAVFSSFKKNMISTTAYATKWYITLFSNSVTFQTQLRLWDVLLLEGRDAVVMIAVAIIWVLKDHLAATTASFETILSLLSSFFVVQDEDAMLKWLQRALGNRRLREDMAGWRRDWQSLVKQGKQHTALL